MKEIPLSRNMVALVDDEDYGRLVAMGCWYAMPSRHTFYARRNVYNAADGSFGHFLMHVVILGHEGVDHRNGNGLDNQRSNLRPATRSQNMANRRLNRNNTSGFKGVSPKGVRWRAAVGRRYLGLFDTPEAAARAYDAAAIQLFGEFARLNFAGEPDDSAA